MERPREVSRGGVSGAWIVMEGGVLSREQRVGGGGGETSRSWNGPKALWFLLWGTMALFAVIQGLAPHWVLSGRTGVVMGILLGAVAAMQLALGVAWLQRKEAALAGVVLVLFVVGLMGQRVHLDPARIDFSTYYVAGHAAGERPPGRLYEIATFPDGRVALLGTPVAGKAEFGGVSAAIPFIYPPFFAVLMRPFALLSYDVAYGVWTAITVVLTLASVWMGLQLGGRRVSVELAVILVVGLFSYSGFFQELLLGQVDSLLLFLLTLGVWLLRRDREWGSALCFAVATMIKITPVLAVPLLVMHRRWKWLAAYGCWLAGLTGFSIWQAGWAAHSQFLHEVMPSVACGITSVANVSIVSFVQELFLGFVPMNLLQATLPPLACAVSRVVALIIFCGVMARFYVCRRTGNLVLHLVLVVLLSLTVSPITWMHHYVMALLPFLYLWELRSGRDSLLLATVLVVGTNLTVFPLPELFRNDVAQLVLAGLVPFLTLALVWFRIAPEQAMDFS